MKQFQNRRSAGIELARLLTSQDIKADIVVCLTRGGVPVGYEISRILGIPLRALVVKKIGSPSDPELAIGAVAPDSVTDIDWQMAKRLGVDEEYINSRVCELGDEIATAEQQYRLHDIPVKGAHVILTDDGIATGATVRVAVRWLREMDVASVCLAVPVLPAQEIPEMTVISDRLVYAFAPQDFGSVGSHFEDFSQVGISEVLQLLEKRKE